MTKPEVVVELGSFLGRSTCHIAKHIEPNAKIYAVDHFLGSVEHQNLKFLPTLYEQFLSNVIRENLYNKVIPVKMSTHDASLFFQQNGIQIDLIYVDASHETEAVYADLCDWYPFVEKKGIMCGDDWGWEGVRIAVEYFAKEKGLSIKSTDNFWQFTR